MCMDMHSEIEASEVISGMGAPERPKSDIFLPSSPNTWYFGPKMIFVDLFGQRPKVKFLLEDVKTITISRKTTKITQITYRWGAIGATKPIDKVRFNHHAR